MLLDYFQMEKENFPDCYARNGSCCHLIEELSNQNFGLYNPASHGQLVWCAETWRSTPCILSRDRLPNIEQLQEETANLKVLTREKSHQITTVFSISGVFLNYKWKIWLFLGNFHQESLGNLLRKYQGWGFANITDASSNAFCHVLFHVWFSKKQGIWCRMPKCWHSVWQTTSGKI